MRYKILGILALAVVISGCASQKIVHREYEPSDIVHYSQIGGMNNLSNRVFYLNAGDTVKVDMRLGSPVAELADKELELVLKKRVFFRVELPSGFTAERFAEMTEAEQRAFYENIGVYLSADAREWAWYADREAIQELFGIKGGSTSLGVAVEQSSIKLIIDIKLISG